MLESGIVDIGDLEIGVELGLAIKPPFAMMNELGPRRVRALVDAYAKSVDGFRTPRDHGPWTIPVVLRENQGDVAVLTLRRPKTMNALTRESFKQLDLHLVAIRDDPKIRGVVLTGFGTKAFAAGVDISVLAAIPSPEDARSASLDCNRILRRIETLGKPVIAALNGYSVGSGSELAYACTARVGRKGLPMLFAQPEVRLGIIPGAGGTQRLGRIVGEARAKEMILLGRKITAQRAYEIGLVNQLVARDKLGAAVEAMLAELAGVAPLSVQQAKSAIERSYGLPMSDALQTEREHYDVTLYSADRDEGLRAFAEGRPPKYQGH